MATKTKDRSFTKSHPWHRERGPGGAFVSKQVTPAAAALAEAQAVVDVMGAEGAQAATKIDPALMPFVELGATGLRHYAGFLDEEFLPALRGRRAVQVFAEMKENDAMVGAMLFAVEMLMRKVEWRVEPASDQPADVELADFVDSCRDDMQETWHDTLASIFSFLPFGFSVHETVYKRRDGYNPDDPMRNSTLSDGRIGWRKLPVRAQDTIWRWLFDENQGDEVRGLVQLPPPRFIFRTIPEEKFILFRTTSAKGNPQGRSVLRNAYRPWYFKRRIEEIEGVGVERDLAGLPKMEVPAELMDANASADKKAMLAEIREMLRQVRRDEREGIIVPREFDKNGNARYVFELVRSGGRRQFDTTQIVNRYDRQIASVVLADFILLGQQRVGSLSLAESKTELFGFALGAWVDSVAQVFNRTAIPRLLLVNGLEVEKPPQLVHGDIETIDLTELGEYIAKLTGAGMPLFPDDELENRLRLQAGLPEKPEETREGARLRELEEQAAALEDLAAALAGATPPPGVPGVPGVPEPGGTPPGVPPAEA